MSDQNTAIQFSFSGGELDIGLRNRIDWQKRDAGAKGLLNVVVRPTGGVAKQAGFRFINQCLHDDKPITLVPFQFSVSQTYILEFGDGVMRVYTGGDNSGLVLNQDGTEYRCPAPYNAEQAKSMRYAQIADAMFFVHPDVAPQQLVRYGHTDWRWRQMQAGDRLPSPTGLTFYDANSNGHNGFEYCVTAYRTVSGNRQESIGYPNLKSEPYGGTIMNYPQQNIASCLLWQDTYRGEFGGYSGFPSIPDAMDLRAITRDDQAPRTGALNTKVFNIMNIWLNAAHGKNATYGLYGNYWFESASGRYYPGWAMFNGSGDKVGAWDDRAHSSQVSGGTTWYMRDFANSYINSNYTIAGTTMSAVYNSIVSFVNSVNAQNSYKITNSIKWSAVSGAQGYYVYRRPLSGEDRKFYRIGDVANLYFTDNIEETVPTAFNPISGLNSFDSPGNYPSAVTFFEQRILYGGTYNKPETIFGSAVGNYTDFTINPSDVSSGYEFRMMSTMINKIMSMEQVNGLLILTGGGEWKYGGGDSGMNAGNINGRQQSQFGSADVKAVIIGESAVFVTRSGQSIRNLSYSLQRDAYAGRDLLAYARHLVAGKRIIDMAYQQEPEGVLWAVLDDGTAITCTYIPDEEFLAWTRRETDGRIVDIASSIGLDGTDEIWIVVERKTGDGVGHQYIEKLDRQLMWSDSPDITHGAFYVDSGLSVESATPVTTIAGLDHLEGREVAIFADGSVQPRKTVANGQITLDIAANVVHVGLPYGALVRTLDLELINQGTLRDIKRQLWRFTVEMHLCRELFYSVGGGAFIEAPIQSGRNLGEIPMPITGDYTIPAKSKTAKSTELALWSPNPVPFGILSVIAEIDKGET